MKRTLLILSLITLTATISRAQNTSKTKVMIFGEVGGNFSGYYQSANSDKSLSIGNVTKPEIALYVKVKYPTLVGFDAGVSASQQGAKAKDKGAALGMFGDSLYSKAIFNYAYVYGDALYFFELEGNNTIHAGVGLYAGYAFNGDKYMGSDKQKIYLKDEGWKRADFGLQIKTAFNFHELLTLGVQYRIAFLPALESVDKVGDPNNLRNSVLTVSAALRLFKFESK